MERKLPPRRLSTMGAAVAGQSIAAAARAGLDAEAAFQQQLREANLKLPIKDAARQLAQQMQQNLDAELKKAVERYLGFEVTDPQQVAGRLHHQVVVGEEWTVYSIDGVPILKAGAQSLERQGDSVHAFQPVEQLLPEDFKPRRGVTLCAACAGESPAAEVFTIPPIAACVQCGSLGSDRQVFRGDPRKPAAAGGIILS